MKSFSNQENFYKRLRELSNVDAPTKSTSLDNQTLVEYSRATDGSAIGIIKEDNNFYIKSSTTKGDIGVEHFTYIGGLENKLKYRYPSLSEAVKIKNFYVVTLNESLERKYNPAKTINEEKELLAKTNADKGGISNAQSVADKAGKGETLKDSAKEKEVGEPVSTDGIAKAQVVADKNKSDDASAKIKKEHEASTVTGKSKDDIAKAQTNADAETKGEALKYTASEKEIAKPTAKTGGEEKAQGEADKNKSDDASAKNKKEGHKEVKPASDAKKEKAIVAEQFGEDEKAPEEPGAGAMASADAAGAESSPMASSGEEGDLDKAASALDALDIKADSDDVNMGAPTGSPIAGADGVVDQGTESPDAGISGGEDGGELHDLEKLVGKTGQKIRSTDISDEMVSGFLKSLLSSFDGKLANLDSDEKRELANKILKAGEEGDDETGSPIGGEKAPEEEPVEPDAENSPSAEVGAENGHEEKEVDENGMAVPADEEIEEAINQHLAAMGKANEGGIGSAGAVPELNAEPAMGASQHPNSFKKYMAERGYSDGMSENVSIMEMVSLVNGYANECGDNYANADMQTIAEYMSPEVKEGVTESGFGKFAEGVEVFSVKPKKYKSAEPVLEYGDEHAISTADALAGKQPVQEWNFDKKKGEEKEEKVSKKDIGFAKPGESLTAKAKEEEKAKKEDVSESAKAKLRLIINNKIQEQLGLKKKSINEGAKSAFSKKLDEMIGAELKKNKNFVQQDLKIGK